MSAAETFLVRPIRARDDDAVAAVIRDVMTAHQCTGTGFAIHDPEVAAMHAAYAANDARYYVVEHRGPVARSTVVGGAGFARLQGTGVEDATCELRKMYFRDVARGRGIGRALLELLLDDMRSVGYRRCYLETTSWMQDAQRLYVAMGFTELPAALGATGHTGCDKFFARKL
jgi:putative acetyltransferase